MKHFLCLFFVAVVSTLITGCSTGRQIQVVDRIQRDTIYINKVEYDSIYVNHDRLLDRSRDTLLIQDRVIEHRYRLLRDTIYKVQIDSIPVIREVEIVKEVRHIPLWAKLCRAITIATAITIALALAIAKWR